MRMAVDEDGKTYLVNLLLRHLLLDCYMGQDLIRDPEEGHVKARVTESRHLEAGTQGNGL